MEVLDHFIETWPVYFVVLSVNDITWKVLIFKTWSCKCNKEAYDWRKIESKSLHDSKCIFISISLLLSFFSVCCAHVVESTVLAFLEFYWLFWLHKPCDGAVWDPMPSCIVLHLLTFKLMSNVLHQSDMLSMSFCRFKTTAGVLSKLALFCRRLQFDLIFYNID